MPDGGLPLAARREPSALVGWIIEARYCNSKGGRGFLQILFTEGPGVRLCWEHSKPQGPLFPPSVSEYIIEPPVSCLNRFAW